MKHSFDTSLRPQDDFFGYINNSWLSQNPIPATETSWGSFYILRDKSWKAVDEIISELKRIKAEKLSHDQQLLRAFFSSALTYEKTTKNQLLVLEQLLQQIDSIVTVEDLSHMLGFLHRINLSPFWTLYVSQDDKDSSNQVLRFYQSGLSMPNRDYYLERSSRMAKYRHAYQAYYKNMKATVPSLSLGPWAAVWRIEKQLATYSWTDIALRNVQKNYTKVSLKKLTSDVASFDWVAYWCGLGWQQPTDDLVVDQFSFIKSVASFMKGCSLKDIKSYLKWTIFNSYSNWLSKEATDLSFDFYGRTLGGQKEIKPLWKRTVLLADRLIIGEALGKEYAARHFPESSKRDVLSLVEDIRKAYHTRIDRLTWMSAATKKRAHKKLDNIKVFVGYPTMWKDLSPLTFSAENVIENILSAHSYSTDIELAKIGQKPAEEEWEMNAHTVNAYNHPNRLEIVFPAAILQPPFYDPKASRAANLGGIGAVIGHEFTHGFDDQGSEFDEQGNTNPWQTKEERKRFNSLAKNIVKQADSFETIPGTFLQGKLILGEAIADIGGLALAVEALEDKKGLSDLFSNFAQCECGHTTPERAVELAKTDPHPPSKFRVNCVVNHVDAFYELYQVVPKDTLYLPPTQRAKIW